MKIIKNGVTVDIAPYVEYAEQCLLNQRIYKVNTVDHVVHLAAYIAWQRVGGIIAVQSPLLSPEQIASLDQRLDQTEVANAIVFHTSGTTNIPKLVIHQKRQMDEAVVTATNAMDWGTDTVFLNLIPAFTMGFWNFVVAAGVHYDAEIVLATKDTIVQDMQYSCNQIVLVPGLVDMYRANQTDIDFSNFKSVFVGSSQMLERHAQYLFDHGAKSVSNCYGTTEVGPPLLYHTSTEMNPFVDCLQLKSVGNYEVKLVNNELWIKGTPLCSNYQDMAHEGEWIRTGDLWEQHGDLIRFVGRTNEVIKVNGFQCSMLMVDRIAEENANLGESMAVIRNTRGVEWIELFYTRKDAVIDKAAIKAIYAAKTDSNSMPRRFTYIEKLPKNGLNKKMRHAL